MIAVKIVSKDIGSTSSVCSAKKGIKSIQTVYSLTGSASHNCSQKLGMAQEYMNKEIGSTTNTCTCIPQKKEVTSSTCSPELGIISKIMFIKPRTK